MKKRIKSRSLGREKDQKKALMRTLLVSLIENKKIVTTLAKAKELKPYAEKKLSLAKAGLENSESQKISKTRILKKVLPIKFVQELFLIAKVAKREGGYTRIIKLMPRKSDSAEMALIEWVDEVEKTSEKKISDKKKKTNKTK
ncbi:MAG: 50S ribosomal protein L17 [Candidatus Moranbacteria bacterium]|nr:50S ribosomal protein L17 [Candidatus Moranbacteria bacterium]